MLQILNSVQQMPRVKTHQNAALLRQEQALLVWGKTTNEVADKLMELEDQIAGAMALDGIQQKEEPLKAAPAPRGFNYSTPISTYLALAGTMAIIMLMVRLYCHSASLWHPVQHLRWRALCWVLNDRLPKWMAYGQTVGQTGTKSGVESL